MHRLPEDIPHRDVLMKAGFVNYAVVKNHRSFESIRGLTPSMAQDVKDYLSGNNENSSDYTISELRDMDLSDKDESFFEGDDRSSVGQFK